MSPQTTTPIYAFQYQPLSQTSVTGPLNAQGDAFLDKNDQTANVLHAIAEFVAHHELGPEMTFDVGGYTLDISVTKNGDNASCI